MSFGERLKEARQNNNMTQEALARAVGVSKGAIGNYESEISSPKEPILIKLMRVLSVDANFLYQDYIVIHSNDLTPEESLLVSSFRRADDSTKNNIRKILDMPECVKKENAG